MNNKNSFIKNVVSILIVLLLLLTGCKSGDSGGSNSVEPPTVQSTSPADQEDTIAPDVEILITFSTDMDGSTINTNSVKLYHRSGTEIAGSVSSSGETASFKADNYLENDIDYTIEVKNSVKDTNGNALEQDYTSGFTVKFNAQASSPKTVRNFKQSFELATNMSSNQDVTFDVIIPPDHGVVTLNGAIVTYDPTNDYVGTDSFTFKANNGVEDAQAATISLTVNFALFSDTDQTADTTATYGEDSDYTINTQSFAYNDASNDTIIDNVTGLIWQKGYSPTKHNLNDASDYCSEQDLGGYDDWRLPTIHELFGITLFDGNSKFDPKFTPSSGNDYWSSTSAGGDKVYLNTSNDITFSPNNSGARCVRGENRNASFRNDSNETATNINTGLTWQRGEPGEKNWENAITYCEGLTLAGKSDWRLPNIKELVSIADYSTTEPFIDRNYFPDATSGTYWSSTTAASTTNVIAMDFRSGTTIQEGKSNVNYTRCVRSDH